MDDEAVDEENDDEDDELLALSGSRNRFPLPGAPKMSWENTATYGAISPLRFGRGEGCIAQRAEGAEQHGSDDTGSFYLGSGLREA
jgi:hypothetical protein